MVQPESDSHRVEDHRFPGPGPTVHEWLSAGSRGAMVARSQILVSGSTATLLGVMTNETGFYVYFCGMPPYATSCDEDGIGTVLLGDFGYAPMEQPSHGDCVMRPGAKVRYRSLPVILDTSRSGWDGTDWCRSTCSTALDERFANRREVHTIQLFAEDCPLPPEMTWR